MSEPIDTTDKPVAKYKKGDRLRVIGDKQPPQIGTVETVTHPYSSKYGMVPASYALKLDRDGKVYSGYGERWLTPADNPNPY
jgi:hypothetical protein